MSADRGVVAVTGAYGYLGSLLCERFRNDGWTTVSLVRTPRCDDPTARHFELGESIPDHVLADVDLLIHCAYDLRLRKPDDIERVNVEGSARLLRAAQRIGVSRVIVVSSMSAYDGTTQIYGRSKLEIERQTMELGGCVVRPGLVYGERPGGMAGSLRRMTRLPVVPLIGRTAMLYPVHENDFADAMAALAIAEPLPVGPIGITPAAPTAFSSVLATFAQQEGRSCRFVPIPWQLIFGVLRGGEALGLPLPFRADSLLGLVKPAPTAIGAEALASLGVTPRPFR